MSKVDGGPAFPMQGQSFTIDDQTYCVSFPGVTVRDWFAGKAMQGMLACSVQPQSGADMYARDAYAMADAMLAAREVKP